MTIWGNIVLMFFFLQTFTFPDFCTGVEMRAKPRFPSYLNMQIALFLSSRYTKRWAPGRSSASNISAGCFFSPPESNSNIIKEKHRTSLYNSIYIYIHRCEYLNIYFMVSYQSISKLCSPNHDSSLIGP